MVKGSQSWITESQSWLTAPYTYTTAKCLDSHVNTLQVKNWIYFKHPNQL